MSAGNKFFQLNESFHHVVWMGDLNYKCVNVDSGTACELLRQRRERELLVSGIPAPRSLHRRFAHPDLIVTGLVRRAYVRPAS